MRQGCAFYSSIGAIGAIGAIGTQWNNIHSIGTPLVNCIALWGLRIFMCADQAGSDIILFVRWYDFYD